MATSKLLASFKLEEAGSRVIPRDPDIPPQISRRMMQLRCHLLHCVITCGHNLVQRNAKTSEILKLMSPDRYRSESLRLVLQCVGVYF